MEDDASDGVDGYNKGRRTPQMGRMATTKGGEDACALEEDTLDGEDGCNKGGEDAADGEDGNDKGGRSGHT